MCNTQCAINSVYYTHTVWSPVASAEHFCKLANRSEISNLRKSRFRWIIEDDANKNFRFSFRVQAYRSSKRDAHLVFSFNGRLQFADCSANSVRWLNFTAKRWTSDPFEMIYLKCKLNQFYSIRSKSFELNNLVLWEGKKNEKLLNFPNNCPSSNRRFCTKSLQNREYRSRWSLIWFSESSDCSLDSHC